MTWSARSVLLNMVIGAALVGLMWCVVLLLSLSGRPDTWWPFFMVLLFFLAGGYVVARRAPRGFMGASFGAFLGCLISTQIGAGPTAKTTGLAFSFVVGGLVALGELGGLGMSLRAAKRGRA